MGITELAELVRAGLEADQEAAQWASAGPWWVEDGEPQRWGDQRDSEVACSKGAVASLAYDRNGALNADHVARHSPQRVLAEVVAKRRLLEQALAWEHVEHDDPWYSCPAVESRAKHYDSGACDCGRDERVHAVLQALATPYQEATE